MIDSHVFFLFVGNVLITIGMATPSDLNTQEFTVPSPIRMAPGMSDNETIQEVLLANNPPLTDIGRLLSVLGWTALVITAIGAVVGLFWLMFVAAERLNRRSRRPVSIFGSPPHRREPTHVREAIVVTGDSPSRRR